MLAFDYNVGAGDTLFAHFWAVQTGGVAGGNNFISNHQGWQNGNSGQNQTSSSGGNVPFNLLDGANAPTNGGNITGALTGSGTFSLSIDLPSLGIPGVSTVWDLDTLSLIHI